MRGLVVPDASEDFAADPVELFFDLAFVFAFSQLVGLLVSTPTWNTIGQATLVFLMLWLPWTQFAWSANAVPGNSRTVRVLFLVATAASVPMAASVQTSFDQSGPLFAIPLAVIFLMGIALMVVGLPNDSQVFRSAIGYGAPTLAAMVVIVIGGFLGGDARVVAWIVGVVIVISSTIRAGGNEWIIRAGHFAERHALIIIVALGEVIVAIGNSVVIPLDEDGGFPAQAVVALVAAGVFAGLLWWAYFDRVQPAFEHRTEETPRAERGKFARDIYTYAHAPIVAGVILSAVAMEEMTLHPTDPLPAAFRTMGAAGILLYFGGVGIGVYRSFATIARERFIAVAAIILLMGVGGDINGVVLLVGIDLILLATLIFEHRRIEGSPSKPGDASVHGASAHGSSAHDGLVDGEAAQ
jgi:low temperature requirement protein LtrA